MKKLSIVFFLLFLICFAACKKESAKCNFTASATVAPTAESDSIARYLAANSLTATLHPNGFYYNITTPGTGGLSPEICSYITVRYDGVTFNNIHFDGTSGTATTGFSLGQLIAGWQRGLPLIRPGGSIILYIPPSLGYGPGEIRDKNNNVVIPANSYLKFTIDLVNVQ